MQSLGTLGHGTRPALADGRDSRRGRRPRPARSGAAAPGARIAVPRGVVRGALYPLTLVFGFALHGGLTAAGLAPSHAAMAAAAAGALAILFQELWLPYRRRWRPARRDVVSDAAFLILVQIALPKLLTLGAVAGAATLAADAGWSPRTPWPHHWPAPAQAALLLLAADLLRYWLHRAAHGWAPLWRLHAAHHAPARLYWLNVGRFHPAEKALQFALDSLPFLLLGVGAEVLSLYFVFFAINGFYQHSNCDVRLGPLNWVISGPELHRWHHSRRAAESATNFGNNLIVWDLLFGTRFLPAGREVGELGVIERGVPPASCERRPRPRGAGSNRGEPI